MFLPVCSRSLWLCTSVLAAFSFRTTNTLTLGPVRSPRFPMGLYSQYGGYYPPLYPPPGIGGCPVCDSSVFSYCSRKLAHDSCCCGDGYYAGNSFECEFADCNYIHANSCRESQLIADCCCEEPYRAYNPPYSRFFK